jgi:hypothetical protein
LKYYGYIEQVNSYLAQTAAVKQAYSTACPSSLWLGLHTALAPADQHPLLLLLQLMVMQLLPALSASPMVVGKVRY